MHFSEGGYEAISSKLFKELKANTYCASFVRLSASMRTLTSFRQTSNVRSCSLFSAFVSLTSFADDTDRAGGFEVRSTPTRPTETNSKHLRTQPLADLPLPKTAVLGLVTSKFPALEKSEDLIHRVNEAASFLARGSGTTKEEALQRCV